MPSSFKEERHDGNFLGGLLGTVRNPSFVQDASNRGNPSRECVSGCLPLGLGNKPAL